MQACEIQIQVSRCWQVRDLWVCWGAHQVGGAWQGSEGNGHVHGGQGLSIRPAVRVPGKGF